MTKLRATRAQVIAAAVIAVLAIVLGAVGLYGLNARGSESGAQVLEDMRLYEDVIYDYRRGDYYQE